MGIESAWQDEQQEIALPQMTQMTQILTAKPKHSVLG
jgi:hypothetical protein